MSDCPIEIAVLMESTSVSGPAKNLIEFARRAAQPETGIPLIRMTLVTYQRAAVESEFVSAAKAAGMPVVLLPESGPLDLRVVGRLRNALTKLNPDIIQSHNIKSHLFVRLTGLYKSYPWIAFNHGYTAVDLKDRIYNYADRFSLPRAYRVVAVCGPFGKRLIARGVDRERIRIQHNSVKPFVVPNAEAVENVRRKHGIGEELVVLCAGRLSTEKGQADLLEAVALIAKMPDIPRFRLLLAGDGVERQHLEQLSARLGIQEKVIFAGHASDMRPYYAMASMLVLPSHSEGSPNVVLEALAAGLAVAATAVGGVPEILEEGRTGLMVPPGNSAALANATARLLRDPGLRCRLASVGQEYVMRSFTAETYRLSLTTLYRSVLDDYRNDTGT
jgi:glycosyltransferase involved in cell wall biosynthesis